jgi:hypothetical protein
MNKVATAYVRYNGAYRLTSLYRDPLGLLVVRLGVLYYRLYATDTGEPLKDMHFKMEKGRVVQHDFGVDVRTSTDTFKRVTVELV